MIQRKKIELTDFQLKELSPLEELVKEAHKGVINGDRRGMLFAQVRPEYREMTVFFLPHDGANMMIDTLDTIKEKLVIPPSGQEKNETICKS